jgi:hypothetical protein
MVEFASLASALQHQAGRTARGATDCASRHGDRIHGPADADVPLRGRLTFNFKALDGSENTIIRK